MEWARAEAWARAQAWARAEALATSIIFLASSIKNFPALRARNGLGFIHYNLISIKLPGGCILPSIKIPGGGTFYERFMNHGLGQRHGIGHRHGLGQRHWRQV